MPPYNRQRPQKKIVTSDLCRLLELDDTQLLITLNDRSFGFELYLEGRTYGPEQKEIILHLLARVCEMRGHSGNTEARRKRLLRIVKMYEAFLFNDVLKDIHDCFMKNIGINLVSYVAHYMIILTSFLKYFQYSKVVTTFPTLQNYMNRMKELKLRNLHIALNQFDILKQKVERYEEPSDEEDSGRTDEVENFRKMSVVPRADDVINYEKSKVPHNIVDQSYRSVGHYLSVHFRLMREDMLRSFRNCIKTCLEKKHSNNDLMKSGGRIYDDITIKMPPRYEIHGICYTIKVTLSSPIDWKRTKGLMPGSLICLTHNDFETVVFVTVQAQTLSRDFCAETTLIVCIEDPLHEEKLIPDAPYQIIETTAYFESYRHLLSAIKSMSEENFPLSDIITYFDFDSLIPEYLTNERYCLHEHKDCQDATRGENEPHPCKRFDVLNLSEWPTMKELNLDDQQLEAFQTALTNKVAVIQGPPGTGKTFIGVKIVKALLENVPHRPILISCMTNHALDQFLALVAQHTRKIVRLGGQSTSKVLEPYRLNSIVDAIVDYRSNGDTVFETMNSVQKRSLGLAKLLVENILDGQSRPYYCERDGQLRSVCNELQKNMNMLHLCENNYADDSALNEIIDDNYKEQLRIGSSTSSNALSMSLFEWLGVKRKDDLYERCKKHWQANKQKHNPEVCTSEISETRDIWKLDSFKDRYALLNKWRSKCLEILQQHIKDYIHDYKRLIVGYERPLNSDKIELLKGADVIGVTTTGASKYRNLIRLARPTIVIIEEAAEVLESHIIATLVPGVQHLILIGDHQQLRPLPFDNELAKRYKLDVSMFERLFENSAPKATLASQHRMKPCIAELLALKIYPTLRSDPSVYDYEEIKGVEQSMFFFDHCEQEDENSTGTSSSNTFEAQFVASLAKYFTMQGYSQSQITIIATYAAQVPLIRSHLDSEVTDVYVTTVDNYQGEENDIILVSFVRSNTSAIGFLKEINRICVALSRAKKGMFCIGNFQLFKSKSCDWETLVDHLLSRNMIGEKLPLQCQKHNFIHYVKCHDDVLGFLSTGCKQKCNSELPCGHFCERTCHFDDIDHLQYQCTKPCEKYMDEFRICPRYCFQPCKKKKKPAHLLPCGHYSVLRKNDTVFTASICQEEVPRLLKCGHKDSLPCHVDVNEHQCRALVQVNLQCGHKKKILCHKKDHVEDEICHDFKIEFSACSHSVDVECNLSLDKEELRAFCTRSCEAVLNCGHPCVGSCRWCSDMGIHPICRAKCKMQLACGHKCEGFCGSPCPPCTKLCPVKCPHGDFCINKCTRTCVECTRPCKRRCDHVTCSKECHEECDVKPCSLPCNRVLQCGHACIGLCGDPCPYLCLICNAEDLESEDHSDPTQYIVLEDCDHVIKVTEMDNHVESCLSIFEWPCCPIKDCSHIIQKSLRYKDKLKQAKAYWLETLETDSEVKNIYYLLRSMYGVEYDIPECFKDINREMLKIMDHDKPSISTLSTVFRTCVMSLKKLLDIYRKHEVKDNSESHFVNPRLEKRFDDLMLWICNHLKEASYQQLEELDVAINELQKLSENSA